MLNLKDTIANKKWLSSNFYNQLSLFLNFQYFHVLIFRVYKIIVMFDSSDFKIWLFQTMFAFDFDFIKRQGYWKHFGSTKDLIKILNIFYLARLCDSITLFLKSLFLIIYHSFLCSLKIISIKHKATDQSACSAFAVITMNNTNILQIFRKVFHNYLAYNK